MHDLYKRYGVKIQDPVLAKAMSGIGAPRGSRGGALVLPKRPEPVLSGGAVARVEEYA